MLGDIKPRETRYELQLKGAGKTPYCRFADGRSISRAIIREHLGSAAMHGLGIPTTLSLAICRSSEPVFREELTDQASLFRFASYKGEDYPSNSQTKTIMPILQNVKKQDRSAASLEFEWP